MYDNNDRIVLQRRITFYLKRLFGICIMFMITSSLLYGQHSYTLKSKRLKLSWKKDGTVFKLGAIRFIADGAPIEMKDELSGSFTFLYSKEKPDSDSGLAVSTVAGQPFPGEKYRHYNKNWNAATSPVGMNTAGIAYQLNPTVMRMEGDGVFMSVENNHARITSNWCIDDYDGGSDLHIQMVIEAKQEGYYSMATPALIHTGASEIKWATIPGYFQGNEVQPNLVLSYGYGQGIPAEPIVFRERTVSTLSSILSRKDGVTVSAIVDPGYGRDPWIDNQVTHDDWNVGLSIMNRQRKFAPTLYYPVLGQRHSFMKSGEKRSFEFRLNFTDGNWFSALKHAIHDVYQFPKGLLLRKNKHSLTNRVWNLRNYVTDDSLSMWRIENFAGLKIGGQAYLGSVVGSQKDAMKNSDYGAMWMMANMMDDTVLKRTRLPYARNFKLAQQQTDEGFFEGAALGQYFLSKSRQFTEEWGEYVEPISLTYYTMLDIGNILLFQPDDLELKQRLRLGADLLVRWQREEGSWAFAYDRATHELVYPDLTDYRPTFYGLIVAYRVLGDSSYLRAAEKGANWYYQNAIQNGKSFGVCGDARYVPDFALAQTAQAFLDLFDLTLKDHYKRAAIEAAKLYVSSVYTHPIPSMKEKIVKGVKKYDWEIAQAGLSFEHGGTLGSANFGGPILLSSHAGMFIRMFEVTKDSVFLNMARSAAVGRDAFVDSATSVASYYWARMDSGAGPFPHHAWWQIGWIMDYLLSELHLRSYGQISFPRGFVTPKVGPHQPYGFAPGRIYEEYASLRFIRGLVHCDDPNIEYITAMDRAGRKMHIFLLNDLGTEVFSKVTVNVSALKVESNPVLRRVTTAGITGEKIANSFELKVAPYGLSHFIVEWK